ncbi:hypothetical protein GCM10018793_60430 [Streptomyces sulfonofaciens]|uniref:HTH tetR-type domain-containing protein n=1 Tax=Streptomyces sulfonofaciens TaxID=68272 RepID=A0A919L8R5_9ACTN|nr:TetR/AcrR family transcriptional regulator [Streptomyces sulfonofaciens]GHH86861.1 hypothetical protein GCM10018793_60430 [Streptomyces sulfonofaciens]
MHETSGSPVGERLLAAADELFYTEGVQSTGVDRIARRAGASKKSLYSVFGSKEALVVAYLEARRTSVQEILTRGLERFDTPRERVLGVFDILGRIVTAPDYNGCPFLSASAEAAGDSPIGQAHSAYRAWVRELLTELAAEAGAVDPSAVGRELHLLYDAAGVAARADRDPRAAAAARAAAEAVLDRGAAPPAAAPAVVPGHCPGCSCPEIAGAPAPAPAAGGLPPGSPDSPAPAGPARGPADGGPAAARRPRHRGVPDRAALPPEDEHALRLSGERFDHGRGNERVDE